MRPKQKGKWRGRKDCSEVTQKKGPGLSPHLKEGDEESIRYPPKAEDSNSIHLAQ